MNKNNSNNNYYIFCETLKRYSAMYGSGSAAPERADALSLNGRCWEGGDGGCGCGGVIREQVGSAGQEELGVGKTNGGKLQRGRRHGS